MRTQTILNSNKLAEYSIILGYFVCLFITTCFFFDTHKIVLDNVTIQLPICLTFFPITFALSNVIQDKFGKGASTSLVLLSFIFDTLLVFGGLFLAYIGDRIDYWTVFKDMPTIMISTWVFMGISATFNIFVYNYLSKKLHKNKLQKMLAFFISLTLTEALSSSLSMPLLFFKHHLTGSVLLTILISVIYKLLANMVITIIYSVLSKKSITQLKT